MNRLPAGMPAETKHALNRLEGLALSVGDYSYGCPTVLFDAGDPTAHLTIGKFCSIAENVRIFVGRYGRHYHDFVTTYPIGMVLGAPAAMDASEAIVGDLSVHIGSDVWLGRDAMVMSGVKIGHGAIIGAGSVVTSDVEPYCIVAGAPARFIRKRFSEAQIARMLATQWWDLPEQSLRTLVDCFYMADIDRALGMLESARQATRPDKVTIPVPGKEMHLAEADEAQLRIAEACARAGNAVGMEKALRDLSLKAFGAIFVAQPLAYPHLSRALPTYPPDEIQRQWTGTSGAALLAQSLEFVRVVEKRFRELTGARLQGHRILDYGCGWGRLLRVMGRYSERSRLFGLDPWDVSVRLCREAALWGTVEQCDYVPTTLPFGDVKFDLVYAFSVFTHLSEHTTDAVQAAVRERISPDGLFIVTIRPEKYWDFHGQWPAGVGREQLIAAHRDQGFAFVPHGPPGQQDITYGDTSMTLDYVRQRWKKWKIVADEPFCDPLQHLVFLRPV